MARKKVRVWIPKDFYEFVRKTELKDPLKPRDDIFRELMNAKKNDKKRKK